MNSRIRRLLVVVFVVTGAVLPALRTEVAAASGPQTNHPLPVCPTGTNWDNGTQTCR